MFLVLSGEDGWGPGENSLLLLLLCRGSREERGGKRFRQREGFLREKKKNEQVKKRALEKTLFLPFSFFFFFLFAEDGEKAGLKDSSPVVYIGFSIREGI